MKIRANDVVDEERKTLKSAVANLVVDNELLRERIRQMEEEKAFSTVEVEAMSRTLSPLHRKALWSGPCGGSVGPVAFDLLCPASSTGSPHRVPQAGAANTVER